MLSGFGEWTRKMFKAGVGAVSGLFGGLTGQSVTSPSPSSPPPSEAPPVDTGGSTSVDIAASLVEILDAMSSTELLITLAIGLVTVYGAIMLIRGRR